ncbi:MAG: hypothetical protein IJS14_08420 [Lentisphaeria bacterium]|nr:hypothetical protein [Lentisphaeria bacterium]
MKTADSIAQIVCPKYPRPARLSDPGDDFSPEELEAIIRKKDADLTDTDLICIFQGALPAGDYPESIHFLPLALKWIGNEDGDSTPTLCEYLLRWIGIQKDRLEADRLYDKLLMFFEERFAELVSTFVLQDDHPEHFDLAETIFESLNDSPVYHKLGDMLLKKNLGGAESYEQAAWLICFLENHLYGILHNSEFLREAAENKLLIHKAYDLILSRAMADENLLRFWDELFTRCGIG